MWPKIKFLPRMREVVWHHLYYGIMNLDLGEQVSNKCRNHPWIWGPLGNILGSGEDNFLWSPGALTWGSVWWVTDHRQSVYAKGTEMESSFMVEPSGCVLVRTAVEEDSLYGRGTLAFVVFCVTFGSFCPGSSWLQLLKAGMVGQQQRHDLETS